MIKNCGNSKIVKKREKMLEDRTSESEKDFLEEWDKLKETNFRTVLTKHLKYFLPSVVDKLYNRGIVSSNYAESTFNALKRSCQTLAHPITTVMEKLMSLSESWMNRLINERLVDIPFYLKNRIPPNIGSWVLNYLDDEYKKVSYVKEKEICNCTNIYHLPCRHEFLKGLPNKINVPKEYLRINNSTLDINEREKNPCKIEVIDLKTKKMNLRELVEILEKTDGIIEFINELANRIINFLEKNKIKWKRTKHMGNQPPGQRKFSSNCDVFINKKKTKSKKINEKIRKKKNQNQKMFQQMVKLFRS